MLQMNELIGSIFNVMVGLGCAYDLLVWVREISSCSSPVFCHSDTGKLLKQSLHATLKQISWSQMHEMAVGDRSGRRVILGHGNTRDGQAWRKIRDTQRHAQDLSRISRWLDNEQKTGLTQLMRGCKWKNTEEAGLIKQIEDWCGGKIRLVRGTRKQEKRHNTGIRAKSRKRTEYTYCKVNWPWHSNCGLSLCLLAALSPSCHNILMLYISQH